MNDYNIILYAFTQLIRMYKKKNDYPPPELFSTNNNYTLHSTV